MNTNLQFLHLICIHILIPREENYAHVTKEDLWLMYYIVSKQHVDLCSIILDQMIGAFNNKTLDDKVDNIGNVKHASIHPSKYRNRASLNCIGYKADK